MNEIKLYDVVKKTKICVMSGVDFGKIVFQGVKSKKSDFLKNKFLQDLNKKSASFITWGIIF